MNIRIKFKDTDVAATLAHTPAALEFSSLLPLAVVLRDYASTEKIADLPKQLCIRGEPPGMTPSVGDITYYAPWGNLAIFYKPFGYSDGLVHLGTINSRAEALHFNGTQTVTMELDQS
jgi:hypothetical protein